MHDAAPPDPASSTPPRPGPVLAGLVAGVLLVHALLLAGLPVGAGPGDEGGTRVLSARQIRLPPAPAPVPAAVPAPPAPSVRPAPTARAPVPPIPPIQPITSILTPPAAAPEPGPAAPPAPAPTEVAEAPPVPPPPMEAASAATAPPEPSAEAPVARAEATAEAAAPAPAPDPAAGGGAAPPVYATRLPPAAELSYELRRGMLSGQGELSWRPAADGYELQIEGIAFGLPLLGWLSRGGYDVAGLAPQRFVDRRRGRDVRAANFQRDKGLITWSGVTHEAALAPGAQDRLSWIVQLAAVVQAASQRYVAGERVTMQVAGARGDADLWTFVVQGREPVDVVGARIADTLALRREPRKPYDTLVEVWLDPARHHLPARLKLSTAGGGDSLEFLLRP